ncbi:MAG: glycerol dehydrogenase [Candidatus Nanopelagicales bacterium]
MLSIFCSPSRYVQGRDASTALGAQMAHLQLPGPVLVIASARTADRLADLWEETFPAAGYDHRVHVFGGECSQAEIDAGVATARDLGARTVVGAGGGKALDTSRAVALEIDAAMVNCPTLASSDAPCSAISVVYSDDGAVERIQFYPRNPDLVLVDTTIVAAAPSRYLVAGMGDALATWYEARTVIEAHGANTVGGAPTMTAGALAELCCRTLFADGPAAVRSVDANAVTPALERVVEANTLLSGLGFESGGLALAHAVHNGLTALAGTHDRLHGEKVAFGLLVQLVVEGRPAEEIAQVRDFCREVGLPTTLAEVGLPDASDEDIAIIAERTVIPEESSHHEPFEVTAAMIADGIRAADGT